MKFSELLNMTPLRTSSDFWSVEKALSSIHSQEGFRHPLSELVSSYGSDHADQLTQDARFRVDTVMDTGDDKYGATLSFVYFDQKLLLASTVSGRYGCDVQVYLFDKPLFEYMSEYLMSVLTQSKGMDPEFLAASFTDVPDTIGGFSVETWCNPEFTPKYKPGDEVWAWIDENHLRNSEYYPGYKGFVLVKAKISSVQTYSDIDTYHGSQIDRGWASYEELAEAGLLADTNSQSSFTCVMRHIPGSTMGARISEALVLGLTSDIQDPPMNYYSLVDGHGLLPASYKVTLDDVEKYLVNNSL